MHPTTSKPKSAALNNATPPSLSTEISNNPHASSQGDLNHPQVVPSIVVDSDSSLSPARSDMSDVTHEQKSAMESSTAQGLMPYSPSSDNPTTGLPSSTMTPTSDPSFQGSDRASRARSRNLGMPAVQWLTANRHHIPVQKSAWANGSLNTDPEKILVHLTFQKEFGATLFQPTGVMTGKRDFAVKAAEQMIESHCIGFINEGATCKQPSTYGFTTTFANSITEPQFEAVVRQLLRCYFLHPSPENLVFEIEFRTIQGSREGKAQSFGGTKKSLGDFHKDHKDVKSLSAVVTKIITLAAEMDEADCGKDGGEPAVTVKNCTNWITWMRVGNKNELVDKFPAFLPSAKNLPELFD